MASELLAIPAHSGNLQHMSEPFDSLKNLVQLHAQQIGEHVDTVHIFVTKHMDGGANTLGYEYGTGNFYARFGQIKEWCAVQDEYQREWARTQQRKDDPE